MIFNPKEIANKGLVIDMPDTLDGFEVQQNGIDLTLASIKVIKGGLLGRAERKIEEYEDVEIDEEGYVKLDPKEAYSVEFEQDITVPMNACAMIVQRSTLNRIGGFITSGLYDSGFENRVGAVLRTTAPIKIQIGARIAQVIFMEADAASSYEGVYKRK